MARERPPKYTAAHFLRDHPLIVVTASVFVWSAVGYLEWHLLLRSVGVSVADVCEVDDLLLAPLRSAPLLIALVALVPSYAVAASIARRMTLHGLRMRWNDTSSQSAPEWEDGSDRPPWDRWQIAKDSGSLRVDDRERLADIHKQWARYDAPGSWIPFLAAALVLTVLVLVGVVWGSASESGQIARMESGARCRVLLRTRGEVGENTNYVAMTDKHLILYRFKSDTGERAGPIVVPLASVASIEFGQPKKKKDPGSPAPADNGGG